MEENAHEMEQWKRRETERLEVSYKTALRNVVDNCLIKQEVKRSIEPLMGEINKIQLEKATMEQVWYQGVMKLLISVVPI